MGGVGLVGLFNSCALWAVYQREDFSGVFFLLSSNMWGWLPGIPLAHAIAGCYHTVQGCATAHWTWKFWFGSEK